MKYEQMSIYDFLNEESQEVPPSETVPQVDETQEFYMCGTSVKENHGWEKPSSDLDTPSSKDTDVPLFFEGKNLKVKKASEVCSPEENPEDYYHLEAFEGRVIKLLALTNKVRKLWLARVIDTSEEQFFYEHEIKEI